MNPVLPDAATEFGATADKAFAALGGVDAARRAEDDHNRRTGEIADALRALGIDDIDPHEDEETMAAAAVLCEAAGRVALPYPVPSVVIGGAVPIAVIGDGRARVDHGDLFGEWRVATLDGRVRMAAPGSHRPLGTRLGPFVTDLDAGPQLDGTAESDVALYLTFTAWQVLGTVDRAVELAVDHVTNRIQFGKPLSAFQAVQFQLADAAVAVAGLRELAHFTLWQHSLADVLALRLHALDVARLVLRTCQQLHGAAGVCDEYDVSVLIRHAQPALRLPWGAERTATELAAAIDRDGFAGLFPHGHGHGSTSDQRSQQPGEQ